MSEIERSTEGLINVQFDLLETVVASKDLDLKGRIAAVGQLTGSIRQVAALELAHKKFLASAPEFAKNNADALRLVKGKSEES